MGSKQLIYIMVGIIFPKKINDYVYYAKHACLMIYRKKENTLEFFDPEGFLIHEETKNHLNSFLIELNKKLDKKITEISDAHVVCSLGFQSIENTSIYNTNIREQSYCQAWVLFIIKYVLKFPELNTRHIIRLIQTHLRDKYGANTIQYTNAHLFLIRSFAFDMQKKILKLINTAYAKIFKIENDKYELKDLINESYYNIFDYLFQKIILHSSDNKKSLYHNNSPESDWSVSPNDEIGKDNTLLHKQILNPQSNYPYPNYPYPNYPYSNYPYPNYPYPNYPYSNYRQQSNYPYPNFQQPNYLYSNYRQQSNYPYPNFQQPNYPYSNFQQLRNSQNPILNQQNNQLNKKRSRSRSRSISHKTRKNKYK
jgi:hypothetical protein